MPSGATGEIPSGSSLFSGLPSDVLERLLGSLERSHYPAGEIVIGEGDKPNRITIVERGQADIFVADRLGVERRIGSVGPGSTLGEMSLFTGQPASGTVRAATDLEVLNLKDAEFETLAAAYPVIYRNLGAIMAARLARTNRLAARAATGRIGVLLDRDGPAELAWALAASIAWHTRMPALLLAVGGAGGGNLERYARDVTASSEPRAHLLTTPSLEALRGSAQIRRLEDLFAEYPQILVLTRGSGPAELVDASVLEIAAGRTGTAGTIGGTPVPELGDRDREDIQRGLLSLSSPAGRAVGLIGRDLAGLKVGLALGAGSLKGYAHFGALHALERLGVPVDMVAGTSVGSLAAATHALGIAPTDAIDLFNRAGPQIFRPTISPRGLLTSRPLVRFFRGEIGDARIEDLDVPLAVVAADLETNREIVFRRGLIWLALLGSMSIPGIFPAVRVGPYIVADGGVLNPVPSTAVADMGADVTIAVRLSTGIPQPEREAEAAVSSGRTPNSLSVLLRSFDIMYSRLTTDLSGTTVVTVTPELPELPGANLRNWSRGAGYVPAGADAVHQALPRLRVALPWLS